MRTGSEENDGEIGLEDNDHRFLGCSHNYPGRLFRKDRMIMQLQIYNWPLEPSNKKDTFKFGQVESALPS